MTQNLMDIVVFGCGGFGREVAWALKKSGAEVVTADGASHQINLLGFLDDDSSRHGTEVNGLPVLGGSSWLVGRDNIGVMIGIGIPFIKQKVVPGLLELGAVFPSFVDPGATIGDNVVLGQGAFICDGTIATCNIEIGDFSMVNLSVTLGHDVKLGKYVTVSPAANLSGYVEVGDGSDLGTDCTVIPGKKIGQNAIIGAMACVTKDVPDYATAVGIPAKVIKISEPTSS